MSKGLIVNQFFEFVDALVDVKSEIQRLVHENVQLNLKLNAAEEELNTLKKAKGYTSVEEDTPDFKIEIKKFDSFPDFLDAFVKDLFSEEDEKKDGDENPKEKCCKASTKNTK